MKPIIVISAVATMALVMASCKSKKQSLTYFEDIAATEAVVDVPQPSSYQPVIKADDELVITVNSLQPEATAPYNLPLSNPAVQSLGLRASNPSQQTYRVNVAGDIAFPQLGTVHVAGMTPDGLAQYLRGRLSDTVDDPQVMVRLADYHVSVLGQVKSPGNKGVDRERYTLLDALAAAGDLTDYGRRDNVLLIREVDGKQQRVTLNLNSAATLTSPYFYLQPGDVIYVSPNDILQSNSRYSNNNGFKLSVISTVVSATSVIASLVIALTVK